MKKTNSSPEHSIATQYNSLHFQQDMPQITDAALYCGAFHGKEGRKLFHVRVANLDFFCMCIYRPGTMIAGRRWSTEERVKMVVGKRRLPVWMVSMGREAQAEAEAGCCRSGHKEVSLVGDIIWSCCPSASHFPHSPHCSSLCIASSTPTHEVVSTASETLYSKLLCFVMMYAYSLESVWWL